MNKITTDKALKLLLAAGAIPVFYNDDEKISISLVKACYKGGMRVVEFTNRGEKASAVFKVLVQEAAKTMPGLLIGVGSILSAPVAKHFINLGAGFIVAPVIDKETATVCKDQNTVWIPGTGSVTEIAFAKSLGASLIKVFPATSVGGAEYIKAVLGPMPGTNLMPTGGVSTEKENLSAWYLAGAKVVGLGSNLIPGTIKADFNYDLLSQKIKNILGIIKGIKDGIS